MSELCWCYIYFFQGPQLCLNFFGVTVIVFETPTYPPKKYRTPLKTQESTQLAKARRFAQKQTRKNICFAAKRKFQKKKRALRAQGPCPCLNFFGVTIIVFKDPDYV